VECSEVYLPQARDRADLEILSEPRPLPFDDEGNLPRSVLEVGETVMVGQSRSD
jgi:hypothetical protein